MKFLNPREALKQFGLYGAEDVADLGSGAGHFSLAAAERLEGGRLFLVDIDKDMLARTLGDLREKGHTHVHSIWGDLAKHKGVPLADESLDKAIAVNILFAIDDRDAFVREIKRLLKPGGKVLLVDWHHGHNHGPLRHHKLSADEAHTLFKRHGFSKQKDIEAGDYHYGMILVR